MGVSTCFSLQAEENFPLADRPDPLRVPEIIIVICVLLLWCASIYIFIRHSELLRIRHRDLPFRPSVKPPMNLNHITIVHRTSDMVIHSKPRLSSTSMLTPSIYSRTLDECKHTEVALTSRPYFARHDSRNHSFDSNLSLRRYSQPEKQLLNPQKIASDVTNRLLDLHRKSMDNLSTIRSSVSLSTNNLAKHRLSHDPSSSTNEARCVQESPV